MNLDSPLKSSFDPMYEDEDPQFIEVVLREQFRDPLLVVHKVSCVLGTSVGDNFLSIIKRATVTGTLFVSEGEDDDDDESRSKRGVSIVILLLFLVALELDNGCDYY